ncbi:MAG: hypothetical protein DRN04_04470 [Thermoprotei archaeon]|nr:MAG: hypothetical protein DRN04_04470 [Thermoprotei archaeon]
MLNKSKATSLLLATLLVFGFYYAEAVLSQPNILKLLAGSWRATKAGWIIVHIEGDPYRRGFQHGYWLADEIVESIGALKLYLQHYHGISWKQAVNLSVSLMWSKVPAELQSEIFGIADGVRIRGYDITWKDIFTSNAFMDLESYLNSRRLSSTSHYLFLELHSRCSGFIATGSATKDGGIVVAHNTWFAYFVARYFNVFIHIKPDKGYEIFMQSFPGYMWSGTDWYITSAGLVISETTISMSLFNESGIPVFVRARMAAQYASSIDEWVNIMLTGNNGAYSNRWYLGDIKTGEIAVVEIGLSTYAINRTKNGYFVSTNMAVNPKVAQETRSLCRSLVCSGYARYVRLNQLFEEYYGKIDLELAKKFISDDYDVYLQKKTPTHRTVSMCGEVIGTPWGAVDAKVADSSLIKKLQTLAIWGHPNKMAFDAEDFLKKNPKWSWQKDYLVDFPSNEWVLLEPSPKVGNLAELEIGVEKAKEYLSKAVSELATLRSVGIYLKRLEDQASYAASLLDEARNLSEIGDMYSSVVLSLRVIAISKTITKMCEVLETQAISSLPLYTFLAAIPIVSLPKVLVEEKASRKTRIAVAAVLTIIIFLLHPGALLALKKTEYSVFYDSLLWFIFAAVFFYTLVELLPSKAPEKPNPSGFQLLSAFFAYLNMSFRNFRKRKLRFFLTLTTIVLALSGILAFTSTEVSPGPMLLESMPSGTCENFIVVRGRSYRPVPSSILDLTKDLPHTEIRYGTGISSYYRARVYLPKGRVWFYGILAVEDKYTSSMLKKYIVEGRLPENSGEIALPSYTKNYGAKLGSKITVYIGGAGWYKLTIVGFFSNKINEIKDVDLKSPLPYYIETIYTEGGTIYRTRPVDGDRLIIVSSKDVGRFNLRILSVLIPTTSMEDSYRLMKIILDSVPDVAVYVVGGGWVKGFVKAEVMKLRGGEAIVLLIFAGLMMFATMSASLYERLDELRTMSVLGLSPTQLQVLGLTEDFIYALLTTPFSFIVGMFLSTTAAYMGVEVLAYKFSATSAAMVFFFSFVICVLASYPAIRKASVAATPSLELKWKLEAKKVKGYRGLPLFIINVPIRFPEKEIDEVLKNVVSYFKRAFSEYGVFERVDNISYEKKPDERVLKFRYMRMSERDFEVEIKVVAKKILEEDRPYYKMTIYLQQLGAGAGYREFNYRVLSMVREVLLKSRVLSSKGYKLFRD